MTTSFINITGSVNGGGPSYPYAMHHQADPLAGAHGIPHHPHVMMDPKQDGSEH